MSNEPPTESRCNHFWVKRVRGRQIVRECKHCGRTKSSIDQPAPITNGETDIQSLVIEDIGRRREVGIERYGTALQPFNGRDALLDAYEEALDLVMYLKQCLVERDRSTVDP